MRVLLVLLAGALSAAASGADAAPTTLLKCDGQTLFTEGGGQRTLPTSGYLRYGPGVFYLRGTQGWKGNACTDYACTLTARAFDATKLDGGKDIGHLHLDVATLSFVWDFHASPTRGFAMKLACHPSNDPVEPLPVAGR